jgi:hypothetical protein
MKSLRYLHIQIPVTTKSDNKGRVFIETENKCDGVFGRKVISG